MKRLSAALTKRLKLEDAVIDEAASGRNLLPEEPGWDRISAHAREIADYLGNRLQAGFHPAPQVEIAARKPANGVRPVPYWGTLERVAYRALTATALHGVAPLDRSPEAHLDFIAAPVRYARDRQPARELNKFNFLFLGETPVKYVVKSDLTAFYQFIDHAVLAEELLLLGVDFEVIEALLELLAEVLGRNYGLPQLLDASDRLSELYADRIERDLLRSGFALWRFNDDFRVACDTYPDALTAIEALDAAARRVGVVLSENKTFTVGIVNYLLETLGLSAPAPGQAVDLDDVEDQVGDYTDEFGEEDADAAYEVIQRVDESQSAHPDETDDRSINLKNLRTQDVRLLRRAVNGLTKASDTRALKQVVPLAIYAPSLTPNLMRYLRTVGKQLDSDDEAWQEIVKTVDDLVVHVSLNNWQKLWLVDVVHDLALLSGNLGDTDEVNRRVEWVNDLRRDTASEALRAVAIRALAAQGRLSVTDVVSSADRAAEALLHIYTAACTEGADRLIGSEKSRAQQAIDAWAKSSVLHACLLKE